MAQFKYTALLTKNVKRYYNLYTGSLSQSSLLGTCCTRCNIFLQEEILFLKKWLIEKRHFQYLFNSSNFFILYSNSLLLYHLEWSRWQRIRTAGIIMHYITNYFNFPNKIHKIYY